MQVHAFANTIVVVNGVEITGWAEGDDVIQIKRLNDSISHKVGAGGSMMIAISSDKSAEITFKLQQGSSSNSFLSSLCQLQDAGGHFFVPVNLSFRDLFRQDMAEGTIGYIKRPSDLTRGAAPNNQEWTIVVERLDMLLGYMPDVIAV